tara:strand:+ start:172 stop:525 length:354 start_codon:yes stop_codon:yes gene_type:complete
VIFTKHSFSHAIKGATFELPPLSSHKKEYYMKCKYHPDRDLEEVETTVTENVPWLDEPIVSYRVAEYCPKCWDKHEEGEPMKHDLVDDMLCEVQVEELEHWESQIDNYIESQVDERK